jgi:hypothetical protein
MKKEVFEAWKVYLEKCRTNNYKIDQLYTFTSALYKKAIFKDLIKHKISSKIEKGCLRLERSLSRQLSKRETS